MKTKEKKDLLTKDLKELRNMLKDARNALFSLRMEKAQVKLKDPRSIFHKRKEIAKILTVLRRKEYENAKKA
ncbi:MAG: 50S ribosomal protein L29 [Candidatus Levybacteria bacterium CG_4_10_14_0_8_um_filter_35_23]|nr:MAG: 50S ribosomal protein L29 [Candidatus Levybacteria bacterium CG_4_10_14_0_8_um_filter_35_23]